MEIENSSLYREIRAIVNGQAKPVHYTWTAELHANGESYRALKVLSIDFSEDYELSFAEEIMVRLAIPGGTYAKRIYPFQGQIEITLYRTPIMETADVNDPEAVVSSERYSATLVDTGNPAIEGSGMNAVSETAMNLTDLHEVSFQLINKALEQLRVVEVGGIYRNTTVEEVVKAVLTAESKRLDVEGARLPVGVDMIEASNKTKREHVVIPQGTRLVDVPEYVHKKCGGIYNAGLGYYLRGDYWYVYPCYDTTRFTKSNRTLTVINVPKNKFPNAERTYRKDGSNLVVLATGEVKFRDDSEALQLNRGSGARFADASKFMEGFVKTQDNKAVASRGVNNSEFNAIERKDRLTIAPVSPRPINANPFVEYSELARRAGAIFAFVWENSQPSLTFPGMMVRILYLEDDEIKEGYGVLVKAHHYVHTRGQGLTDMRYATYSTLSVFIKQEKEE